ncbi:MAG: fatty acid desaturase [Gammaproteobacteria bacterium]|jgi:fatty acid desaturase
MNRADERFKELQRTLQEQGAFEKEPVKIIAQTVFFVSLTFVGIWILNSSEEVISELFAFWLVILSGLGISTNAHTAGHGGVSTRPWVNKLLLYFGFTFFLQVSRHFWHNKHNVIHHQLPNILERDGDVDLQPYVALTHEQHQQATGWRQWYFKYQWVIFPFLLAGNAFGVVLNSWRYLLEQLRDPTLRKPAHFIDLGVLLLHIAAWYVIPCFFFAVEDVLLFNVLRLLGMSYGMYALFAPAHMTQETILLDKEVDTTDFMALQTYTAINYRTGWIGRLICGGVEFQIEHHLFPLLSHTQYPRISKTIEAFCQQHNYPYRSVGWGTALWRSWMALRKPKTSYGSFPDIDQLPGYTNERNVDWRMVKQAS